MKTTTKVILASHQLITLAVCFDQREKISNVAKKSVSNIAFLTKNIFL